MGFINAIILGLVQGLTEFLPISSNAHVRIVGELLGLGSDPGAAFTAIIQLGTEAAVVVYFAADLGRIISRWFRSLIGRVPRSDPDAKMGWYIIFGSIPIVILGILFQTQIETVLRSLWVIAITLIVFGILLGIADYVGAKKRRLKDLTVPHAVVFGFAQSLALIPGVSRSGGTITAGLFLGYERPAAARYSFLLAIPAVIGSGFFELYKTVMGHSTGVPELFTPAETAVATGVAFVVGLLVIVFFMN